MSVLDRKRKVAVVKLRILLILSGLAWATGSRGGVPVKIDPDVVYGHKDGLALTMDVLTPAKPNGAGVVFIVSGGYGSRWYPPAHCGWR